MCNSDRNSFKNENYWQSIADDVLNHIPVIPSGEGRYNEWLHICMTAKCAGYTIEDVQKWSAENDTPDDAKWNSFPDSMTEYEARKELVSIAHKHGYSLPKITVNQTDYRERKKDTAVKIPHFTDATPKAQINWLSCDEIQAAARAKNLLSIMFQDKSICVCKGRFDIKSKKYIPDTAKIQFVKVADMTPDILSSYYNNKSGMYYQLNTVDDTKFLEYRKDKPYGSVKKEHISSYQYYYLESDLDTDTAPTQTDIDAFIEKQKNIIECLDLPWIAIVHSGNKSLHIVVRLDADSEKQFAERIKNIHSYCIGNGYNIDRAVKDCQRFGRFPYSGRGDKHQYIMAINDNPVSYQEWESRHPADLDNDTHGTPAQNTVDIFTSDGKKIDDGKFLVYLESIGYRSCEGENGEIMQVVIDGKFIERQKMSVIIADVSAKIKSELTSDQYSIFVKFAKNIKQNYLAMLQKIPLNVHQDTADEVYFYFKNGALKITANDTALIPYADIENYIWKDTLKSLSHDWQAGSSQGDWQTFCRDIMGDLHSDGTLKENPEKLKVLQSSIGYLLSRYKSRDNAKAILFTDRKADNSESTGGTGKSLLIRAIGELRAIGETDCRSPSVNSRFAWANYKAGQSIYCLQDIRKDFDCEDVYCKITDDFEVEKKCIDKYSVPFESSPKIVITSNFIPKGMMQVSTTRRIKILELENLFRGEEYTPINRYGHPFFYGWNNNKFAGEWDAFYNYMVECVQIYLREGLLTFTSEDLERKKILNSIPESIQAFYELWSGGHSMTGQEKYHIKELWNKY